MKILTVDGLEALLDEQHWETHVVAHHPELVPHKNLVIETLRNTEGVYRSKRDPTTRIYVRKCVGTLIGATVVERTNLLVFVREENGFVVTAYFAVAMWHGLGERIWPS